MEIIKVSSKSNCNSVAGALANILKKNKYVEVQVIGAGALNQLIKAIIICRGFLIPSGLDITCVPSFSDIKMETSVKTGIKMQIKLT